MRRCDEESVCELRVVGVLVSRVCWSRISVGVLCVRCSVRVVFDERLYLYGDHSVDCGLSKNRTIAGP